MGAHGFPRLGRGTRAPENTGPRGENWQIRGACRSVNDPDLFFPIGNTGPALLQIEEAKAVCRRCPVIVQCGGYALEQGVPDGVWGGMSEDDRKTMRRRAARAARKASTR